MKLNHPDIEFVTQKLNRELKTYPKSSHAIWCDACDAKQVHLNSKCTHCGFTHKTQHRKKVS
jgi:uncharacterized paraquat-inducible protein A